MVSFSSCMAYVIKLFTAWLPLPSLDGNWETVLQPPEVFLWTKPLPLPLLLPLPPTLPILALETKSSLFSTLAKSVYIIFTKSGWRLAQLGLSSVNKWECLSLICFGRPALMRNSYQRLAEWSHGLCSNKSFSMIFSPLGRKKIYELIFYFQVTGVVTIIFVIITIFGSII